MSDRCFFDTNILIYPLQEDAPEKRAIARQLLADTPKGSGVISYQVLQEFCNACLQKFAPIPRAERLHGLLIAMLEQFTVVAWSPALLPDALEIHYRYKFHWYDSLIVAAALQADCETLYTEDLQHGQMIESLRIVNPFL